MLAVMNRENLNKKQFPWIEFLPDLGPEVGLSSKDTSEERFRKTISASTTDLMCVSINKTLEQMEAQAEAAKDFGCLYRTEENILEKEGK
jgi:hypothetical protein